MLASVGILGTAWAVVVGTASALVDFEHVEMVVAVVVGTAWALVDFEHVEMVVAVVVGTAWALVNFEHVEMVVVLTPPWLVAAMTACIGEE
mmetsp:Transcript_13785/g.22812  ORF Transcript_13785/g.22812 Transcript_13785/m.22812 type:complete len:91 (+) Transcript_13785:1369-1641(+)